jgi:Fe-S-cluster containining protein
MVFKCKEFCGNCCGIVPIPTVVWNESKDKIQKFVKEIYVSEVFVLPYTEGLKCCFLTDDKKCAIYDKRPDVCKRYGLCDELPCPYFKKSGNEWSEAKAKQIRKQIDRTVDFAIKILGQETIKK